MPVLASNSGVMPATVALMLVSAAVVIMIKVATNSGVVSAAVHF